MTTPRLLLVDRIAGDVTNGTEVYALIELTDQVLHQVRAAAQCRAAFGFRGITVDVQVQVVRLPVILPCDAIVRFSCEMIRDQWFQDLAEVPFAVLPSAPTPTDPLLLLDARLLVSAAGVAVMGALVCDPNDDHLVNEGMQSTQIPPADWDALLADLTPYGALLHAAGVNAAWAGAASTPLGLLLEALRCERDDGLLPTLVAALDGSTEYLHSLVKDDGTDDDHPSRSVVTSCHEALDRLHPFRRIVDAMLAIPEQPARERFVAVIERFADSTDPAERALGRHLRDALTASDDPALDAPGAAGELLTAAKSLYESLPVARRS